MRRKADMMIDTHVLPSSRVWSGADQWSGLLSVFDFEYLSFPVLSLEGTLRSPGSLSEQPPLPCLSQGIQPYPGRLIRG